MDDQRDEIIYFKKSSKKEWRTPKVICLNINETEGGKTFEAPEGTFTAPTLS